MNRLALVALFTLANYPAFAASSVRVLSYENPDLVVDLHVGLWAYPLPCDYDKDGDNDLLVCSPDQSMDGTFFFENVAGEKKHPVFKAPVRVGEAYRDLTPSYRSDGTMRLLVRHFEIVDVYQGHMEKKKKIYPTEAIHTPRDKITVRGNQWYYVDYDGDGDDDLIVGIGDWEDYGMEWDKSAWVGAFDENGKWLKGPLHGWVYLIENRGTSDESDYAKPRKIEAAGKPVDVYGRPSPNFGDFDGDGDLDLLCGEFLDGFTYFQNVGTRQAPEYTKGVRLAHEGTEIKLDLEMIVPVAFDWDNDGDLDLVVGDEDGRVALVEHTGKLDNAGTPQFLPPYYFKQHAGDVVFGALTTPMAFDWDGDGDDDILTGNTAGHVGFIENVADGPRPKFAAPVYLTADLTPIRVLAGPNGSCQGPSEAKWGYTSPEVADWDHDGLPDVIVNTVWGKVLWYENIGTRTKPMLTAARPIEVDWEGATPKPVDYWWQPQGRELATQWRTTPQVVDWNQDGLNDLVMIDHEGYLALYERTQENSGLRLQPGKRVFYGDGPSVFNKRHEIVTEESGPLQLTNGRAGDGGRIKIHLVDWDLDGHVDLFVGSSRHNNWMKGRPGKDGRYYFKEIGPICEEVRSGHSASPTSADWNRDGARDLLMGAEDGRLYVLENPWVESKEK